MFAYCLNNPVALCDASGTACTIAYSEDPLLRARMSDRHSGGGGVNGGAGAGIAIGIIIGLTVNTSQEEKKVRPYVDVRTDEDKKSYQYWEADLVNKQIQIGKGLSFHDASLRVAMGLNVMCVNRDAARWLLIVNCYWGAVGPETHGDAGYFWHYHPHRHTHTHIWYLGE